MHDGRIIGGIWGVLHGRFKLVEEISQVRFIGTASDILCTNLDLVKNNENKKKVVAHFKISHSTNYITYLFLKEIKIFDLANRATLK